MNTCCMRIDEYCRECRCTIESGTHKKCYKRDRKRKKKQFFRSRIDDVNVRVEPNCPNAARGRGGVGCMQTQQTILNGGADSAVVLNEALELVDDFGHRRAILMILRPHALDEIDNLWTPSISEPVNRRSGVSIYQFMLSTCFPNIHTFGAWHRPSHK